MTCVGLAADLLARLEGRGGTVGSHFYLASAEEEVESRGVTEYVSGCRPPERNENDHCLLACQVRISGRRGVLLLDSGYHVPRTVCVMADQLPPHTGEVALDCLSGQLTHAYQLSPNGKFCIISRTSTGGVASVECSCVFVGGRFDNPYAFAEYRNIFHTLRSLVRRSADGRLLSGLFFALRPAERGAAVSVFWHAPDGQRRRCRLPLSVVAEPEQRSAQQEEALKLAGRQLRMTSDQWHRLLQQVVDALSDRQFIDSILRVNDSILYQLAGDEAPPGWQPLAS